MAERPSFSTSCQLIAAPTGRDPRGVAVVGAPLLEQGAGVELAEHAAADLPPVWPELGRQAWQLDVHRVHLVQVLVGVQDLGGGFGRDFEDSSSTAA